MAAYVIADVEVTNPAGYEPYRALAGASIAQYGGRFVVRGGAAERLEGPDEPARLVVIEFADTAAARTHPWEPFGLIGNWTRYHVAEQSLPIRASSALKVVRTWFAFRNPKFATTLPPGVR